MAKNMKFTLLYKTLVDVTFNLVPLCDLSFTNIFNSCLLDL